MDLLIKQRLLETLTTQTTCFYHSVTTTVFNGQSRRLRAAYEHPVLKVRLKLVFILEDKSSFHVHFLLLSFAFLHSYYMKRTIWTSTVVAEISQIHSVKKWLKKMTWHAKTVFFFFHRLPSVADLASSTLDSVDVRPPADSHQCKRSADLCLCWIALAQVLMSRIYKKLKCWF